jgi:hypothetical protein
MVSRLLVPSGQLRYARARLPENCSGDPYLAKVEAPLLEVCFDGFQLAQARGPLSEGALRQAVSAVGSRFLETSKRRNIRAGSS